MDTGKSAGYGPAKNKEESGGQPSPRRRPAKSFKQVNAVLNCVVSGLGLERRLREHTFMNLWPILVGSPWDKRSRPLFIDREGNLVVAVCDAPTGQELSLLKPQMLRKLAAAARSLNLEISGFRLDLKHFHSRDLEELELMRRPPALPEPTEADLNDIRLTPEEQAQLEELSSSLGDASLAVPGKSEGHSAICPSRIRSLFERELRLRHFRRVNRYPVCKDCQIPTLRVHGPLGLCLPCYLKAGSPSGQEG